MNIRELIEQLQDIAVEHGDDIEVRLAHQPSWPFEYAIERVEVAKTSDDDDDTDEPLVDDDELDDENDEPLAEDYPGQRISGPDVAPQVVCYLAEGGQIGYLPGAAARALGWGGR